MSARSLRQGVESLIAEYEKRAANESARFCRADDVVDDLRQVLAPYVVAPKCADVECRNQAPHPGEGRGCVHYSLTGSDVPDRHDVHFHGGGH